MESLAADMSQDSVHVSRNTRASRSTSKRTDSDKSDRAMDKRAKDKGKVIPRSRSNEQVNVSNPRKV